MGQGGSAFAVNTRECFLLDPCRGSEFTMAFLHLRHALLKVFVVFLSIKTYFIFAEFEVRNSCLTLDALSSAHLFHLCCVTSKQVLYRSQQRIHIGMIHPVPVSLCIGGILASSLFPPVLCLVDGGLVRVLEYLKTSHLGSLHLFATTTLPSPACLKQ